MDAVGAAGVAGEAGLELPSEGGYRHARPWLASTFLVDDWSFVGACLVVAVDPCELAQLVNVEQLAALGRLPDDGARGRGASLHDVRVKMEFDGSPRVWRIEASHGGLVTCVQDARHADAVEDMAERPFFERGALSTMELSMSASAASMSQILEEAERAEALLGAARERYQAFDDACQRSLLPPTWGGLADAAAMAAETIDDRAFVDGFAAACASAAVEMRPSLQSEWDARKNARTGRAMVSPPLRAELA